MSEKKAIGAFTTESAHGHTRTRPYRQYVEIAVLGVAIALIWTVLTLPTIFYHLPVKEDLNNSSSTGPGPILQSDECSSEVYTGSVCRNALQSLQNCIPDRCGSTEVYILSNTSQNEIESHVRRLLGGLQLLNPSSECLEAVGPFLCSYYFGLCSSDNQPYLPSSGQCEKIATETCAVEFEKAIQLLGRERLPQCETLSEEPTIEFDCTGLGECPGVPENETVTPETSDPNTSSPTDSDISEAPNGTYSPVVYTGQICRSALQSLQNCIPDRCGSTEVYILSNSDTSQNEIESHVTRLLGGLQLLNPSSECLAAIGPFLCSYYFGLCSSDNQPYLPSSGQCEKIATETCAAEFEQAIQLLGRERLPQCETLSALPTLDLNCTGLGQCPGVPENETVTSEITEPGTFPPTDSDISESPNGTCSPEVYTGQVCRSALQSLQNCIPDRCGSTEVYILSNSDTSQNEIEGHVTRLLGGLQLLNPRPECLEAIGPFLCSYYFGLCSSDNQPYLPSSGQCEKIAAETCATEFEQAIQLLGRERLPQCETLSAVPTLDLNCTGLGPCPGVPENETVTSEITEPNTSSPTDSDISESPNSTCSPEVYTGQICRTALQSLQNCIPDRCGSTEVYIPSNSDTNQNEIESHVTRLLGGLQLLNPRPECLEAIGPFLCSYYFGLCSSDNQPYLPSSGQCEKIATETCAAEFEQAIRLLGRDGLPQCETLSTVLTLDLNCTGLGECPGVPENETVTPETTDPNTASPTDSDISESPNSTCSPEVYTGQICRSALQSLQNCIPDRCGSTEVYIPSNSNTSQNEIETHVTTLLGGLGLLNPRPECLEAIGPFLCSFYFGLCSSDNQPYLPSSGQCETIATETCATEFQQAISLLGRDGLPQCETLSTVLTLDLNCTGLGECPGIPENGTVTPETTDSNTASPTDSDIPESPNGTCLPEVYTGQVCRSALQSLQNCVPDRCGSTEVYIPSNSNTSQNEIETHITTLLGGLGLLNPRPECLEAIGPFLCSYYFGLCSSGNQPYLPSSGQCEIIATETCAAEFQQAISLLGRDGLPQCETLSAVLTLDLNCTGLGECPGVPENETVTPETTEPNTSSPTDSDISESPNGTCSPEVYTGQVCRSALQSVQNCIPDRCGSTEVYILSNFITSQNEIETHVTTLLGGLGLLNPRPECLEAIGPFLCSYYFGLCSSDNQPYLPSSRQCVKIATETCAAEFQQAIQLLGRDGLPQCETLPAVSTIELNCAEKCEAEVTTATPTDVSNTVASSVSSGRNISSLTCRKGFYLEQRNGSGRICVPECGKWEEFPHHVVVAGDVIVIIQAVVYIIAAAVLLVMVCIHHKRMFKFPAIFVIYEMFPLGLFEVFILIGFMDRTTLYCSSKSLIESLKSTTVFCNMQGAVTHFIFMQQLLLWFLHIVAVFWTIKFPLHAKSFENKGYTRFVHFGMLALTFIVPAICTSIVFGTGGCRGARIPAIICLAQEPDVTFYAFVLPLSIVTAAGISLIVVMLWILYHITRDLSHIQKKKHEGEKGEKETLKRRLTSLKHHATINAAEMKILIIFIYFSVFLGSILITFTIRLHGIDNLFLGIGKYFSCESIGIQEEECVRSFERVESEASAIITYALIGFYPLVSLIYVVNLQELKQKCSWLFKHTGHKKITSSTGTFRLRGSSTSTGV